MEAYLKTIKFHFQRQRFYLNIEGYRVIYPLDVNWGDYGMIYAASAAAAIAAVRERGEKITMEIRVARVNRIGRFPATGAKWTMWKNPSDAATRPVAWPGPKMT
jgi:hypothetical protein